MFKVVRPLAIALMLPLSAFAKPAKTIPQTGDLILADLGSHYAVAFPYADKRVVPPPRVLKNAMGVWTVVLYGKYASNYPTESVTLVSKTNPTVERLHISCSPGTTPSKFSPWIHKGGADSFDLYGLSALRQSAKESYMKFEKVNVICRAPQDGDPSQKDLIKDVMGDPEIVALDVHGQFSEALAQELARHLSNGSSEAAPRNRDRYEDSDRGGWSNYICNGGLPARTEVVYASSPEQAHKRFCGYSDPCLRAYTTCRQR